MARLTRTLSLCAIALSIAAAPVFAQQRTTAQKLEDRWVTTKIEAEYFLDSHLKPQDIQVSTMRGLVTVLGTVPDLQTRNRAVAIAHATDGVKNVVDMLTLDTDTQAPAIHVSVAHGVVTLTGTVGPIAHERALELARSSRGVSRVDDEMTLK